MVILALMLVFILSPIRAPVTAAPAPGRDAQKEILYQLYPGRHFVEITDTKERRAHIPAGNDGDPGDAIAVFKAVDEGGKDDNPMKNGFYIKKLISGRFVDNGKDSILAIARRTNTSHVEGLYDIKIGAFDADDLKLASEAVEFGSDDIFDIEKFNGRQMSYFLVTQVACYQMACSWQVRLWKAGPKFSVIWDGLDETKKCDPGARECLPMRVENGKLKIFNRIPIYIVNNITGDRFFNGFREVYYYSLIWDGEKETFVRK